MKYLLHRLTALLLAVLLLCSAGNLSAIAAQPGLDPACVLGTEPSDMLAGGGRRVRAEDRQLYIDDTDGSVYALGKPRKLILEGPVEKLNYADGVLYYARAREESRFDLCAFDMKTEEETVLLAGFSGQIGQLYLVNGTALVFSCGNAVWELELETGAYRLVLFADELWSFVPTGCGLVYAVGTLFDYTLYVGSRLLAEHVSDYTLRFDLGDGLVVYTVNGTELQADLADAFMGDAVPAAFAGTGDRSYTYANLSAEEPMTPEQEARAAEAEAARLQAELEEAMAQPENRITVTGGAAAVVSGAEDPDDPQRPADADPAEPEPAEPEPTEPAPAEPEPTEPAPTEPVGADDPIGPDEPEPTYPEPTEPEPTDPEPTQPAIPERPTDPEPTEPESTEPAGADAPIDPDDPEPTDPEPADPAGADAPIGPASDSESASDDEPSAPTPASFGPAVEVEDPPVVPTAAFVDGALRAPMSQGQQNIVKRARQMLNIKWTPRKFIGGWGYYDTSYTYYQKIYVQAGETYTGLPYGQGLNYVPWSTSLSEFAAAVKDTGSKLYTTRCTYSRGSQYYGTDCSGFASWAWQTEVRKVCATIVSWSNTVTVGWSYTLLQAGDALIKSGHAILVTDVTYNSDGSIASVEISQANPTTSHNGCCYSTRYTGQSALTSMNNSFFVNGSYTIYRSSVRDSVTYTHSCAVPLEGDVCNLCGVGLGVDPSHETEAKVGVDVSRHNEAIDWMVLSTQIDFAILRVGYTGNTEGGHYKDANFDVNVAGCEAYNVPYGVYWYAGATTPEEAMQEAEKVVEYLGLATGSGHVPTLPIFYDIEETRNILKCTDTEIKAIVTAFCGTLEDMGFRTGVYACKTVWSSRLTSSIYNQWARWVAQWQSSSMNALGGAHIWQYGQGTVPGVNGAVDLNYWLDEVGVTDHASMAVVDVPSCVDLGTLTCTSVSDGAVTEYLLPAPGHNYVDGVCTRCGLKQDVFERFTDVYPGKYYSEALVWAVENGITSGTSPTTFSPNRTCTREQVMTFLWKAAGSPAPAGQVNPFEDVPDGKYYRDPVLWAYYHEPQITGGVSEASFGVGYGCTRAQVVTFLYAAAGAPAVTATENPFADVEETDYYYQAVLWAYENGVTGGTTATTFSPKDTCTRAQIVTFLYAAQKNR